MKGYLKKINNVWYVCYKVLNNSFETQIYHTDVNDKLVEGTYVRFDLFSHDAIAKINYGIDTIPLNIPKEDLKEVKELLKEIILTTPLSNDVYTLLNKFIEEKQI